MELNLDARKAVTAPAAAPLIDFADASTYNNATSLTVYDAKGQDVAMSLYFQKSANDEWNVFATANGTTVGGVPGAPLPITTITFQSNGSGPIVPNAPVAINVPASNNAQGAQTEPINGLLIDLSGATQFGSAYGVTDMRQDGYTAGLLTSVSVEPDGIIMARYSNGQSKPSGQIELANFRNPQGLQPLGDNAWARTYASGDPVMGVPGDGNLGVLQAGALEESNVDLTGELVNMITAQRIYQANAQSIKTQDQVLQTLVNLR
jgi:flagellar hook protein FlgE